MSQPSISLEVLRFVDSRRFGEEEELLMQFCRPNGRVGHHWYKCSVIANWNNKPVDILVFKFRRWFGVRRWGEPPGANVHIWEIDPRLVLESLYIWAAYPRIADQRATDTPTGFLKEQMDDAIERGSFSFRLGFVSYIQDRPIVEISHWRQFLERMNNKIGDSLYRVSCPFIGTYSCHRKANSALRAELTKHYGYSGYGYQLKSTSVRYVGGENGDRILICSQPITDTPAFKTLLILIESRGFSRRQAICFVPLEGDVMGFTRRFTRSVVTRFGFDCERVHYEFDKPNCSTDSTFRCMQILALILEEFLDLNPFLLP